VNGKRLKALLIILLLGLLQGRLAAKMEVLLLTETYPGTDAQFVEALRSSLEAEGFAVKSVSDPSDLSPTDRGGQDKSDHILILPNSACFPVEARPALLDYLKGGGNLLTIGGPLLSRQVVKVDGEWLTQQMLMDKLAGMPAGATVLDFGIADEPASRDTGTPETQVEVKRVPGQAMEVSIPSCTLWEFQDIPVTGKFGPGETVTTFQAKGSENVRQLTLAWIDSDNNRWVARIDVTTEWKRYALTADQFELWRGKEGRLDTSKVAKLKVGFENHNLRDPNKPATYWITDVHSMPNPAGNPDFAQPTLETLSPSYKTYSTNAASLVRTFGSYEETGETALPLRQAQGRAGNARVVCSLPRYRGLGFNKTAPHRWIPQLAVKMVDGHIGGAAAALYVQDDDEYKSVWATLGIEDPEFLATHRKEVAREAVVLVKRIDQGLYLLSGGVDKASYFEGEPVAGAVVLNRNGNTGEVKIECTVGDIRLSRSFALPSERTICELGPIKGLKPGFYTIVTSMYRDGKLIDQIREPFSIVESKAVDKSELVTIKGDQFIYKGKPWYSLGINYRPLYVAAMEREPFWQHWCHPDQYDAEIVEMELSLMNKIGLNTVALIYENSEEVPPAFVDFMERAHRHGIKCHVYLAGLEPNWPNPERALALIKAARLWERPAMFAYDTGWEVRIGVEDKRQGADPEWKRWLQDRYGSVDNAEKDWGFTLRKGENGRVHGPTDEQVSQDGPWNKMVAAYRRFWDDRFSRRYMKTAQIVDSVDPYHPISVRSGFNGTGTSAPFALPQMPVDLFSGAKHLDYISPEGYNISGDWQSFREAGFTTLYGKFASRGKPVYWAELGYSAATPERLEEQRQFYEKVYRMFYETRSAGSAAWWWPGYLIWEHSDFAVMNPDFTLRPAAYEYTKMAKMAATPYPAKKPDYWIEIDRDEYAIGYAGMLADKRAEYGKAVSEGKTVGLRTKGTGTDTSNFPKIAVGDTPLNGHNPPKFLNAEFNSLEINGVAVQDGDKVQVKLGMVQIRASVGNIAETRWLAKNVNLQATGLGKPLLAPIAKDTPFLGDSEVKEFALTGIQKETKVGFQLVVDDIVFGEKRYVMLEVK
jgi:hypothetical protein